MPLYLTKIIAIDPKDGEMKEWAGPILRADNAMIAQQYLDENELGYCAIVGTLEETIEDARPLLQLPKSEHIN